MRLGYADDLRCVAATNTTRSLLGAIISLVQRARSLASRTTFTCTTSPRLDSRICMDKTYWASRTSPSFLPAGRSVNVLVVRALPPRWNDVALPTPRRSRGPQGRRLPATARKISLAGLKDASDYEPRAVTARLVKALGTNAVAALLGVDKDWPGRWAPGQDAPTRVARA